MNKIILDFLKEYGSDEHAVNKLIISAFLLEKNIYNIKNQKINNLLIRKDELEYSNLLKFRDIIKKANNSFCFEELLELFEFVISPSDKLINGAIYTPKNIREYITKQSFEKLTKKSLNKIQIADIACGCGGFLIDASREVKAKTNKSYKKIFEENIYGVDIQKYSVERTKILLALLAITEGENEEDFEFNIDVGDSLEYDWKDTKFDMILGNPPYVCSRNMDDQTKKLMQKWSSCKTGHPDLYIPFFQIGFELLKPNGILGFITVNTFIHSINGRAIRQYFEDKKVKLSIIDFEDEQIFKSRLTYTAICFLQNMSSENVFYSIAKRKNLASEIEYTEHLYQNLDTQKGWYLKNREFIEYIESIGIKLGEIYNTKSGIATLKNSVYIFKPIKEIKDYYYLDDNTKIEKGICRDIVNSNLLVKIDNIDSNIEQIIFPYKYDKNGKAHVINEEDLKKLYPNAYKYLCKNKKILFSRDKGKGEKYLYWYAYGRNQSLDRTKYKLLFPELAKEGFNSFLSENENLYFYNGMAAVSNDKEELMILQKIFMTKIFWKYISSISKYYASNYFSLGKNYIKNFGIFNFSRSEKNHLLNIDCKEKINNYFYEKYYNKN